MEFLVMRGKYNFRAIEKKWVEYWESKKIYAARDFSKKPKFYGLVEFPYPSGDGLHVGHIRSYTAMDVISRKRRMEGYNVLYPIGWDAFGLPTENYAVKTGIHPKIVTKRNTDTFRRQMKSLGFSFDWDREINTTDPKYYKWTQWIFLQFYKKGLAYKKKMPINWCLSCKIGLANEEVLNGQCERCGGPVRKREKEQWLLAITKYADRLLKDLDTVDYLEKIKIQQRNWIGKSDGAEIEFRIKNLEFRIKAFTTRPDTLFGATYMVLAPEHQLIKDLEYRIKNLGEVKKYIKRAKSKSDLERTELAKEKTGVEIKGIMAINPATKKEIPIWVADYVLASYGTGAIMAVPAHDERDFEFAKKYKLPIKMVICPNYPEPTCPILDKAFAEGGHLVASGKFDGMDSEKAKWEITKFVGGKKQTQYHLRDWIFSRQRYWGEPIPLIFCPACKKSAENPKSEIPAFAEASAGKRNSKQILNSKSQILNSFSKGEILNPGWVAVSEKDLAVELPNVKNYQPTDTGESPLAAMKSWVNVKCPRCGSAAKRETDTMPNWAGSSWYFLRYVDPKNNKALADPKKLKYWMGVDPVRSPIPRASAGAEGRQTSNGVDWYNGGMEHTTLHLLYSRFWNKFLYDLGAVPIAEPYQKRTSHGFILAEGGEKMSKSKGNVINPDSIIKIFGADAVRIYEMFIGPFDQAALWNQRGLVGISRFLGKAWHISQNKNISTNEKNLDLERLINKTIKKVGYDIENMSFNTAVSALMIFVNVVYESEVIPQKVWTKFLLILAPFAPFMSEELWQIAKSKSQIAGKRFKSVHEEEWPKYDPKLIQEENFELVIQINGKVRDRVAAPTGISRKKAETLALSREKIKSIIKEGEFKTFFVPNRLINIISNLKSFNE